MNEAALPHKPGMNEAALPHEQRKLIKTTNKGATKNSYLKFSK